jgi:hypothetical protein
LSESPEINGLAGRLMREVAPKLQNSLFFSLLAGNLRVETGSTTTASATNHSGAREVFRSPLTAVDLAGFFADWLAAFSLCEIVKRSPPAAASCDQTGSSVKLMALPDSAGSAATAKVANAFNSLPKPSRH